MSRMNSQIRKNERRQAAIKRMLKTIHHAVLLKRGGSTHFDKEIQRAFQQLNDTFANLTSPYRETRRASMETYDELFAAYCSK